MTTTRLRVPAVFLAVAALLASLLAIGNRPAQASHLEISVFGVTNGECDGADNNVFEFPVELQFPGTDVPQPADNEVKVDFVTVADGSAVTPDDYLTTSGTLTIPQGSPEGTVKVTVICDGVNETSSTPYPETFSVYYDNARGASFESGTDAKATGQIEDGTPPAAETFSVVSVTSEGEGDGDDDQSVDFVVEFSDPSACTPSCTVDYATVEGSATDPEDYEGDSGTLTWAPTPPLNSKQRTVTVDITNDEVAEEAEHFFLTLSNPSGGTIAPGSETTKAPIADDDANRVAVHDATQFEDTGTFLVPVRSDLPLDEGIYVVWETSEGSADDGSDYVGTGGKKSTPFPADSDSLDLPVGLEDDTVMEPNWRESFFVTICLQTDSNNVCEQGNVPTVNGPGDPTLVDGFGKMTILDDEPKINLGADQSATEGETMSFIVSLEQFREGQEITVKFRTVDGTAKADEDYEPKSGTLRWDPDDEDLDHKSRSIKVKTLQDGAAEGNHKFRLELFDPTFAGVGDASAEGLITDDDAFNVDAGPAQSGESAAPVSFTGSADCPNDCTYTWDFGDGTPDQKGVTVKHRFAETGTYTVSLTVEGSSGSSATDTTRATITDSGKIERSFGSNREGTAIDVSRDHWNQADTVLLATGYAHADALAAGPLAKKLDAPLLLTNPNGLPDEVKQELDRLDASKVIILGGVHAVPQEQADELAASGYQVQRIAGVNRFGTAADIATEVGATPTNEVTVSLGQHADENRDDWPDALSAGSFASLAQPLPSLLTHSSTVPQETMDALADLDTDKIFLLGGNVAISDAVEQQLEAEGYTVQRVFGADRYATSVAAGEIVMDRYPAGQVHPVIATGQKFPDGLTGGALAGKVRGPVVLVPTEDLDNASSVRDFLRKHANPFDVGTIAGGEAVVSSNVQSQARSDIDTT